MSDLLNYYDTNELAERLYEIATESNPEEAENYDYMKEDEIKQLEEALYYLKTVANNEMNKDYFKVLWNVLQSL